MKRAQSSVTYPGSLGDKEPAILVRKELGIESGALFASNSGTIVSAGLAFGEQAGASFCGRNKRLNHWGISEVTTESKVLKDFRHTRHRGLAGAAISQSPFRKNALYTFPTQRAAPAKKRPENNRILGS